MPDKMILLVEDNPDDEALMLRAFQRSKLANQIEVARDGAEALEFLLGENARPLPTLVILDLKLPKVDGLEVLRRVRGSERTRTLPVVVLTSSREEQDLVESYRLGANSYVRKPVDFVQFAEATQTLGLYWLVVNEPPPSKERA
jgi:CheY-like chemotaxis protein